VNDPYRVLGVPRGVSDENLHDAYRRLVKLHHPDRGGDPERFKDIQQAYEELRDRPRSPRMEGVEDRIRKMEDDLREAYAARQRAREAARAAAAEATPPTDDDDQDSFGRIVHDVRVELNDKFQAVRKSPVAGRVHDLIDGLEDLASRLDKM
jgi:curved DNA-binding protein CbpA